MRKRHSLTFNLEDERHLEADRIISEKPLKQRSGYIIDCVLKAKSEENLKAMVKEAVLEAIDERGGISVSPTIKEQPVPGRIPDHMMDFLNSL